MARSIFQTANMQIAAQPCLASARSYKEYGLGVGRLYCAALYITYMIQVRKLGKVSYGRLEIIG